MTPRRRRGAPDRQAPLPSSERGHSDGSWSSGQFSDDVRSRTHAAPFDPSDLLVQQNDEPPRKQHDKGVDGKNQQKHPGRSQFARRGFDWPNAGLERRVRRGPDVSSQSRLDGFSHNKPHCNGLWHRTVVGRKGTLSRERAIPKVLQVPHDRGAGFQSRIKSRVQKAFLLRKGGSARYHNTRTMISDKFSWVVPTF
jgi:hypothetical protein